MRSTKWLLGSAVALLIAMGSAQAQEQNCPMPYAKYEASFPHLDLEECPADLKGEKRFCRVSIGSDQLLVAVFSEEGEQCLMAFRAYDPEAFRITFPAP